MTKNVKNGAKLYLICVQKVIKFCQKNHDFARKFFKKQNCNKSIYNHLPKITNYYQYSKHTIVH